MPGAVITLYIRLITIVKLLTKPLSLHNLPEGIEGSTGIAPLRPSRLLRDLTQTA